MTIQKNLWKSVFLLCVVFLTGTLQPTVVKSAEGLPPLKDRPYAILNIAFEDIFPGITQVYKNNPKNIRTIKIDIHFNAILDMLKSQVDPTKIDFILVFTLKETPGWIDSGMTGRCSAQNIGMSNTGCDNRPWVAGWPRLRQMPIMNSVHFMKSRKTALRNYPSTLTAFHEIGHHWGVYWVRNFSVGPKKWKNTDPVAWLAAASEHWTWTWDKNEKGETMPGILYSGATNPRYNAFDLYAMGLLGYQQASQYSYPLYEYKAPQKKHILKLTDLIAELAKKGSGFYQGNGRRVPDLDPSMKNVTTLLVVLKEPGEKITTEQDQLLKKLARDIPPDWKTATWNLSSMSVYLNQ